jgi:hypothetical protein
MAHSFLTTVSQAITNLTTLQIVTTVVAVDVATDAITPGGKAIRTRIDLLQGDITTEMDPVYLTAEYAPLREFHTTREGSGLDIIQNNVKALQELIKLAGLLPEAKTA